MKIENNVSKEYKIQPIVYIIGITAALAGLLFGLDTGAIAGAETFIQKEFGIGDKLIELIVSSLMIGAFVGVLVAGVLSKNFGRKKTLLMSSLMFILGALICALAPTPYFLVTARFILGLAVGVASFTTPLYLAEISPEKVRGGMTSMYQLMITIGLLLAFVSDMYLGTTFSFHGQIGAHWRIMLGISALPAFLMMLGICFLPESPRWFFLKGMSEKGIEVFRKMMLPEAAINQEISEIEANLNQKQDGWKLFFTSMPFRKVILLGMVLQIIQQLTGINVIMYYAPRIFGMLGFADVSGQMWATVIVGIINILATFIAIAFVDKIGRKPIMYAGFIVMGISLTVLGVILGKDLHQLTLSGYYAVLAILTFITGFAMSAGPIVWVLCAEIFPLAGRDLGNTFSTSTNWISNAILTGTFLTIINTLGKGNTFLVLAVAQLLFIFIFLAFVPETKGVSLEHIEANLMSGKPLRKLGEIN